jgi:hypothetical protein
VTTRSTTDRPRSRGTRATLRRRIGANLVISVVLLAVFIAVYVGAQEWPFRTRLFPVMVSVAGATLALVNILLVLFGPSGEAQAAHRIADVEIKDEDDEEDEALEYVFESASRREWFRVLSWVTAFFLGLYLLGAIVTIPVFTLLYLLLEARTTILVSAVYAGLLGGVVYGGREFLNITLPAGLLFSG